MAPGNAVKLNVLHKGTGQGRQPDARPVAEHGARPGPTSTTTRAARPQGSDVPRLGLTVAPRQQRRRRRQGGVVVTEVDPKSPAAERGFKEGDVILEVGGKTRRQRRRKCASAINAARTDGKNSVLMRVKHAAVRRDSSARADWIQGRDRFGHGDEIGTFRRHQSPPPTAFRGTGRKPAPSQLPSDRKTPPSVGRGLRAVRVPQLHRPLFFTCIKRRDAPPCTRRDGRAMVTENAQSRDRTPNPTCAF